MHGERGKRQRRGGGGRGKRLRCSSCRRDERETGWAVGKVDFGSIHWQLSHLPPSVLVAASSGPGVVEVPLTPLRILPHVHLLSPTCHRRLDAIGHALSTHVCTASAGRHRLYSYAALSQAHSGTSLYLLALTPTGPPSLRSIQTRSRPQTGRLPRCHPSPPFVPRQSSHLRSLSLITHSPVAPTTAPLARLCLT